MSPTFVHFGIKRKEGREGKGVEGKGKGGREGEGREGEGREGEGREHRTYSSDNMCCGCQGIIQY